MPNRFLCIAFLLFIGITTFSQGITRQEVDSMIKALNKPMGDSSRIDLLLNLAQFHIFKPGEAQIDFDSALVYINEARDLNRSLKSFDAEGYQLLTESYLTKEKGQETEGKKMVEKAITVLKSGSNKSYLGSAYFELSMYYGFHDSLSLYEKMALVNQSLVAFQQAGNVRKAARSLEMLGDLTNITHDYPKSIEILKQALTYYNSTGYRRVQGVYILLGQAYKGQREYGEALFYMLKALKTARMVNDTSMQLCQINNILGTLYLQIDRKDLAIKNLQEALKIAYKYHDGPAIILLSINISNAYNYNDQPDQALKVLVAIPKTNRASLNNENQAQIAAAYLWAYLELKQYGRAQTICETITRLVDSGSILDLYLHRINRLVARYYFETGQYAMARNYLTKNLGTENGERNLNGIIEDSRLWYKLDSAQGNFRSAFNHLLFFKTKADSLLSESRVRQLQVLGVEYETGIKEDSIKLYDKDIALLTQENRLQQSNLKQASLIRNVTIAGIILALVIISLLYRQYSHKQKSNKAISDKNEQLEHLLTEKEWLLKEIHHRVKNNLQMVMSLLNSQSAYIENTAALTAINESQHRVHAMSLIHQKLYNTENVSSIDMTSYTHDLVSYLKESFDAGKDIKFELNIEPLELDVSQAVPLGLILNEAITNSIKYAFPEARHGIITISLSQNSTNLWLLSISDNGVGIPAHIKNKKAGSLGMSLMEGLTEDLDGDFSIENNQGTIIKILFAYDRAVMRPGGPAPAFPANLPALAI